MTEPAQVPRKDVIQISSIEVIELDKLRFVNFNFLRALLIGSLSSSIKTFFFHIFSNNGLLSFSVRHTGKAFFSGL